MRHVAGFGLQFLALLHTEAMLLVYDYQPEFMHINFFGNQSVSADNHLDFAAFYLLVSCSLLFGRQTANKQADFVGITHTA